MNEMQEEARPACLRGVWGEEKKNRGMKEWEGQMKRDRETKRKVEKQQETEDEGF